MLDTADPIACKRFDHSYGRDFAGRVGASASRLARALGLRLALDDRPGA
jgi:hypothetical protein